MSCIISYLAFDKCGSSMKWMVDWDDEENGESEMDPFEEASETNVSDDGQSNDEEPRIKDVLENLSVKTVSRERTSDLLHSMAASKDILFWTRWGQILRKNSIIPVTNIAELCISQIEASTFPRYTPGIWRLFLPGREGIWLT